MALAGACAPRARPVRTPSELGPASPPAPRVHSSGAVEKRADGAYYVDAEHGFELRVPDGWTAALDFPEDEEGPPAIGELRARLRAQGRGCAIDVATMPPPPPSDLAKTLSAGRDLYFLARANDPLPASFPNSGVWAASTTPAVANVSDTGYWIVATDAWIRVEGRFSTDRFPECKEALDQVVRSMASMASAAPAPAAPQASKNRG